MSTANLDDLLNDIDINSLPQSKNISKKNNDLDNILNDTADTLLSESTKIKYVSPEIKPWLASSANVPKDLREKWTKMAKIDTDAVLASEFDLSNAYRSWDNSSSSKSGISKCLQELVRKAATKCEIDDVKTSKILGIVNPVTDSENGNRLQLAFTKQVVKDLKDDITADPNYNNTRFPNLAALIEKLEK